MSLDHALAPALAGQAFQQTALVGMLPALGLHLGLEPAAIGLAVSAGLLATAAALPLIGMGAIRLSRGALLSAQALLGAGLCAMILAGPRLAGAAWTWPALAGFRVGQGVVGAAMLTGAQAAAGIGGAAEARLGRLQSAVGLGRMGGALTVGPLLWLSPVLPVLAGPLGALAALMRPAPEPSAPPHRRARPVAADLPVPLLVQTGVGAAQIALAPALVARLGFDAGSAATAAGLCLAAAGLGLLAVHRWITPRAGAATARAAAVAAGLAGLVLSATQGLAGFFAASGLLGGAAGLLLTLNLARALARDHGVRASAAAWNGTAQMAGLALGTALGSAALAVSDSAPFAVTTAAFLILAAWPSRPERTTP